MGLDIKETFLDAIDSSIRSVFRVAIIKRTVESGLAFLQAYGHGDPDDTDNQELVQERSLDHAQHFGFTSHPPTDSEGIVADCDGGNTCIAERWSLENLDTHGGSDQMPDLASGDTCIYAKDGTYIFLDSTGKLTIKAMTDNVEIITESGKQVKLGQTMASTKDAAYAYNQYTGSSKVACGPYLDAWTTNVKDDIAAIKADLDGLRARLLCAYNNAADIASVPGSVPIGGAGNVCGVMYSISTIPNTSLEIAEDTDHSYISSGSTKVEIEP